MSDDWKVCIFGFYWKILEKKNDLCVHVKLWQQPRSIDIIFEVTWSEKGEMEASKGSLVYNTNMNVDIWMCRLCLQTPRATRWLLIEAKRGALIFTTVVAVEVLWWKRSRFLAGRWSMILREPLAHRLMQWSSSSHHLISLSWLACWRKRWWELWHHSLTGPLFMIICYFKRELHFTNHTFVDSVRNLDMGHAFVQLISLIHPTFDSYMIILSDGVW